MPTSLSPVQRCHGSCGPKPLLALLLLLLSSHLGTCLFVNMLCINAYDSTLLRPQQPGYTGGYPSQPSPQPGYGYHQAPPQPQYAYQVWPILLLRVTPKKHRNGAWASASNCLHM